ncbi:hypothetical protein ACFL35_20725 [Candidatus Riflebacteria bacterium]
MLSKSTRFFSLSAFELLHYQYLLCYNIFRALINEPAILLADEPTGFLDQKEGRNITHILKSVTEKERTLLIFTHADYVASAMSKCYTLTDGKISGDSL